MPPISPQELIHTQSLLARAVIEARRTRDAAAQAVEQLFISIAERELRVPIAQAELAACEQAVLDAEAGRIRFRDEQTLEFRLKKAGEDQAAAIRQAQERSANAEANHVRAAEERIVATEALAVVLGKELQP